MGELISFDHYLAILSQPAMREPYSPALGEPYVCVDTRGYVEPDLEQARMPVCPVIAVGPHADETWFDLHIEDRARLEPIIRNINEQPLASATLMQLLRHNRTANLSDGLFAESLCYSALQQSAGFRRWLEAGTPDYKTDTIDPLLSHRAGSELVLTLNRPHAHNAYSSTLKDALCGALHAASADASLTKVVLHGNGPSFCAGGDLSEFGQVTDAAEGHLSRTTRSAGMMLAELGCHTEVHLHGACMGAGIEIPAFADRVFAREETFFQLPEVNMGLVPGAGGTVSITRRIGRHRTAWLAVSNERLNAVRALDWGLVDELN